MTPDRWRRIEELFNAAIDLPEDQRASYVDKICSDDSGLRKVLHAMLEEKHSLLQSSLLTKTWVSDAASIAGTQLGVYRLEEKLGAGGMGEVFRATDTRLNRSVALKVCHEWFSERFQREGLALSALNHPNICTLFDVGPNYIVMELVDGSTLAARISAGAMPVEEVLRYGIQIAEALAEAHRSGIVHRDLKPSNIMVTRHGVKVLDFGLAKMISQATVTATNAIIGTPAYMAPEQIEGNEADAQTDLFALGLVLYEMVTGSLPFPGTSYGRLLLGGPQPPLPPLSVKREGIPREFDALVRKLLEREPAQRYQTAAEVVKELTSLSEKLSGAGGRSPMQRGALAAVAALLVLLIVTGAFFYRRAEHRRWAREEAIPGISELAKGLKPLEAFRLAEEARTYLPDDPKLAQMARDLVRTVSVVSNPAGAKVEVQDYLSPEEPWLELGTTGSGAMTVPAGYLRWRLSKPGFQTLVAAPPFRDSISFLLESSDTASAGTVPVPGGGWGEMIDFIGWLGYGFPAYDIDRFEVTNRQFQTFVDQGGYRKPEYWKEKFVQDGRELTWDQAMELLRDPTGRPGPSTWNAGHFPPGQEDFPVSGVSWYEAAAYAAFAGKSLPAIAQWYNAAPPNIAAYSISQGNFNGRGPVKAGAMASVGPFGTYDMIGNVREWCLNPVDGDRRLILGGAWGTQTYQAYEPEALPPLDRSAMNGIRTVRNHEALPAATAGPVTQQGRDFSKAKPASDEVFQVFKTTTYAYDRTPLNATKPVVVEETADWTKQMLTIDAGYGGERLPVFLFLPKNVKPPYQSVVFFPSARVNTMPNTDNLGDLQFVDYVIQSGRALIYPIYRDTYNRARSGQALPGQISDLELVVKASKEVRRSVDYIESLPQQFDAQTIAYLGVSQGTAYGVIFGPLEDRVKTYIFLDGGFFLNPALPARDQASFAPRIKKPVLMINGKYDFTFSLDRSQKPMFEMLGSPAADKKHVILNTPHDVSQDRPNLSREVLAWLDKYLGKIN
jgi:eukaryotic-like serine/threonine-protein kinase